MGHWEASETAFVIIDMWNTHWCDIEVLRSGPIGVMVNDTANQLRQQGVLIIHSPSDCVGHYSGHPTRSWVEKLRNASLPTPRNHSDPVYPINADDQGCDSTAHKANHWTKQMDAITIHPEDAISAESGWWPQRSQEMWNIISARKIKHVLFAGVATNMCVLGRPFGIKAQTTWGLDTALVRELTDTMYNPMSAPYVTHDEGTRLQIEFIEQFWAPTASMYDLRVATTEDAAASRGQVQFV